MPHAIAIEKGSISDGFKGDIVFEAGADGFGSLVFKDDGVAKPVLDVNNNQVQLNGENVTYSVASDGSLVAMAGDVVAFRVTLNGNGTSYEVTNVHKDFGLTVTTEYEDFEEFSFAGNNPDSSKLFESDSLVIQATGRDAQGNTNQVNGSNPGMGVDNTAIDPGEVFRFDFFDKSDTPSDAERSQLTSVDFTVDQTQGATMYIDLIWSDIAGYGVPFASTGTSIYDQMSNEVIKITFNGTNIELGASDYVTGKGWKVEVGKAVGNNYHELSIESDIAFNAIQFESGGGDYRLQVPSKVVAESEGVSVDEVYLDVPVIGTDADGDTIEGNLHLTLGENEGGDFVINGGEGNDILIGGAGDDIFKWGDGDAGTVSSPAHDTVKDFGLGNGDPNGEDKLDLADLLTATASDDLTQFLSISYDGANTVINVSSAGGLVANGPDQIITLEGVNLVGSYTDQTSLINSLVNDGKLVVVD